MVLLHRHRARRVGHRRLARSPTRQLNSQLLRRELSIPIPSDVVIGRVGGTRTRNLNFRYHKCWILHNTIANVDFSKLPPTTLTACFPNHLTLFIDFLILFPFSSTRKDQSTLSYLFLPGRYGSLQKFDVPAAAHTSILLALHLQQLHTFRLDPHFERTE